MTSHPISWMLTAATLALATLAIARDDLPQANASEAPASGAMVVRVPHATRSILEQLESLRADFWTHTPIVGQPIEVALSRSQAAALRARGFEFEVIIEDLDAFEASMRAQNDAARSGDATDWYAAYRTPEEFTERLELIEGLNPTIVRKRLIGLSIEGRRIEAYRITGAGLAVGKRAVVLIGGTHAREWVAHMASMYTLEQFVRGYGDDPEITQLLDRLEFIFIPLLNPDGTKHSHDVYAWWRKNRRGDGMGGVWGVDNNRNYSVGWGRGVGSGETYPGEFEFSEPENQALRNFLLPMKDRVAAVVDVHASGGVLFTPYSYQGRLPVERYALIAQASEEIAAAMSAAPGLDRTIGWRTPGSYGGTSKDWAFDELEALSWTFELGEGWMGPVERIKPWGRSLVAGAIALGQFVDRPIQLAVYAPGGTVRNYVGLGEPFSIRVEAMDGSSKVDPASVRIYQQVYGESDFVVAEAEHLGDEAYRAELMGISCDRWVTGFYAEATTIDGQVVRVPADGSLIDVTTQFETVNLHPCETTSGWAERDIGDTATTGLWSMRDPVATALQPENDTTLQGSRCLFTDPTAPSNPEDGMVNGVASMRFVGWRPEFRGPASGKLEFSYWAARPHGSPPVAMVVEVSTDQGATWEHIVTLEADHEPAWKHYRGSVPLPHYEWLIMTRFRAGVGEGDVLGEFGIDDVRTVIRRCDFHPGDFDRNGVVDLFDMLAFQGAFQAGDPRADLDGDGELTIFDFLEFQRLFEL
ncbi:MAG: M14 family zinc carboxypeptidase [Phycisphaerales bacterium]|jgi:carboxypeptidase B